MSVANKAVNQSDSQGTAPSPPCPLFQETKHLQSVSIWILKYEKDRPMDENPKRKNVDLLFFLKSGQYVKV